MDTIKKKMLAMKNEKDSAQDKAEQLEQSLKDVETAKSEVEEERDNLQKQISTMEADLDTVQEGLVDATQSLEEAEKAKHQDGSALTESDKISDDELLIVVLDDDDELVIGKQNNLTSKNRKRTPRNERTKKQPNMPHYTTRTNRTNQRPQINTQKLAQRLTNIRNQEDRRSPRRGSPDPSPRHTPSRRTPDHTPDHIPTRMVQSDPHLTLNEKPRAVIAKPVERKRRKKRSVRPEPEGAALNPEDMTEWDKIIYNDDPIFSDYGTDEENKDSEHKAETKRSTRSGSGISLAAFAIGLGLNSNTMIKYTIISTELQNIIRVSLRMYEEEIQGLNRRLQLTEEKLENLEERLTAATSKLEEASQAADDSER